ncbi:hypothetical protein RND81_08G164900 [Saponaria officinalis]|uniref:Reverse transcriptase domain-containing protein n=1 Tax=Saponaria officinalis TaxID=3572 RepID=A0AAW1J8F6_SAPOF
MIFTDDLTLFGDLQSVKAGKNKLDDFAKYSGLHANEEKTNIYYARVHETGFQEGIFPYTYLGIPLKPGRIQSSMYIPLYNKIQAELTYSRVKLLPYAGKLKLINSVIFGLEKY